jgi:hypothetical protein
MQAVRSKGLGPALDSRRGQRLRRLAAVCERQPRGQLAGRLFWGLAVERHHRRWYPGRAAELSSPAVADGRHLDLVRTPADGLFEMMNCHVWDAGRDVSSVRDFTRLSSAIKRSGSRRRRPQPALLPIVLRSHQRKICGVRLSTRFSRGMHRFSTDSVLKSTRRRSVRKVECVFGPEWLES